jgi:hypothetical protein
MAGAQLLVLLTGVLVHDRAVPGRGARVTGSWLVGHDAVVGAAGAGGAGAGAVAAQHLRGGPAVQLHQVAFCPAAVQPGVAEVMPEPVRVDGYPGLPGGVQSSV